MTSMPASRSARAMILAPRSCPSKPGLATTTRILPLDAASTAGRDPIRHAAAGDSRCAKPEAVRRGEAGLCRFTPGGTASSPRGDRRHALARRGIHLARGLLGRAGDVLRPACCVGDPPAALLPADLAAVRRRRGVAADRVGARRRWMRGCGLVGGAGPAIAMD